MELVGVCVICGISVYCRDGFLDGVTDKGSLYCHDCYPNAADKGTPGALPNKESGPQQKL